MAGRRATETEVTVDGRSFPLSNPDKVLFPAGYGADGKDGVVTKRDLVDYYRRIADVMVHHLRSRPLMLARYPDGIDGPNFYQKDVSDYFPEWIERVEVAKQGGTVTHPVCDDAATLAYLAGQASITPHAWLSRADRLHHPDRLVVDLDPSGADVAAEFEVVRSGARLIRDLLDEVGLVPFVQTTGSRGLHVVAPLDRSADFDEVRGFARSLARLAAARDPDRLTTEHRKAKRGDRVFLDVMRNAYAQTAVPPYGVRPRPGAPVATPLEWRELADSRLGPQRYTVRNMFRRLGRRGDPWADIDGHARPLAAARERLNRLPDPGS
jgi:bifunctional non-homologous end joining protein LigD